MPALVTDTGQHAVVQGTAGRIEERLARPGEPACAPPALTAGGSQAIQGRGSESALRHRRGKPTRRLIEAQPLIKWCGPAWVLAAVGLLAGNGTALTLLERNEGSRERT